MTTIAYDGTTLAADRRSTDANAKRCGVCCKVTRMDIPGLGPCRVGAAGEYPSIGAAAGTVEPNEGTDLLAVDSRGRAWVKLGKSTWMRAPRPRTCAIGSGRDIAMGAMLAGADAAQAVRIAAKVDPCTGDGVDTL